MSTAPVRFGEFTDSAGNLFKNKKYPDKTKDHLNGFFKNGRLCGYGICEYKGDDLYTGMFKDGKRSGQGAMVFK